MKRVARLVRDEGTVLLAALAVVLFTWAFAALANRVVEGQTQNFDERVILLMRRPQQPAEPIGPRWLKQAAIDLSALGGPAVLVSMTLAVVGYLLMERRRHAMWLVLIASAGGTLLSYILKETIGRQRPSVVPHLALVHTPSFPSGHAMLSAIVYLTLGSLLMRVVPRRREKIYFVSVAMMLTFLIGLTRIYLGVHYPTDVLAGWSAGLVWALLCWLTALYLQRRGAVEQLSDSESDAP
ncbi:MAG TPA: phosphatase PAP2 family protein [Phycisphaerae bacterium]|jgi:undecaprenyl-diphosphatase